MWPFSEMSLSTATLLGSLANWALLGSLVVGVAASFVIFKTADVKEEYWDRDRVQASERIASLNENTARLSADAEASRAAIAQADARAKEAELALARLQTARSIKPGQAETLTKLMRPYSGMGARVWLTSGTSDIADLAMSIANVLKSADLSVGTGTSLSGRTFQGVIVLGRTGTKGSDAALALAQGLADIGIDVSLGQESKDDSGLMPAANMSTPSQGWQPDVFIVVGSKL